MDLWVVKYESFQYGMSLDVGGCFQRDMSLNGSRWVDHGSHGDRHERDATVRASEQSRCTPLAAGAPVVGAVMGRRGNS